MGYPELYKNTVYLLLVPVLLLMLSNLSASEAEPVYSGYFDDSRGLCRFTDNNPQALEHFKNNTRFIAAGNPSGGVCLGLACAWLQAVTGQGDTRLLLSQRLQTCSQESKQGWQSHNQSYHSLEQTFNLAQEHYNAYRTAHGLPDEPAHTETVFKTGH